MQHFALWVILKDPSKASLRIYETPMMEYS
jgi:hypothetical protein